MLKISLLGTPIIERDGVLVETDTRKATAILAYLAVTDKPQTREGLAAMLWPEFDESRARGALRRTLSVMKLGVGEGALGIGRENVSLLPGSFWCDVNEFAAAISAENYHAAAQLYRADFLSGFTLRDAPDFDEWQYYQSDHYRSQFASALDQLIEQHSTAHEFDAAIRYAQRWLAQDPLREETHRTLMRLHTWAGDRSAALKQFKQCMRVLEDELGVEPLRETQLLHTAIREDRLELPEKRVVVSNVASERAMPVSVPFVGRSAELTQLQNAYRTIETHGTVAAIEGEAGIGKTRLVTELLAQLPTRTLTLRCFPDEQTLAYAPLLQLPITETLPVSLRGELQRLFPQLRTDTPAPTLDDPAARTRFFETLVQAIDHLFKGAKAGALFVDDVQWADEATLAWLAFLMRRLRDRPIFLLLTFRSEAVDNAHPVRRRLADMQREGQALHLRLARLSLEALTELVEQTGRTISAERLHTETEGVPFFAVAYLQAEDAEQLPTGVRALLQTRIAALDEVAQQILQTAAVLGSSASFELLHQVSGRDEERSADAVEALLAHQLLVERDFALDFSHHKLRELVYEALSALRRRLLHKRAAQQLRQSHGQPVRIAHHFEQAGEVAEAATAYVQAAVRARQLYANAEAVQLFERALALRTEDSAEIQQQLGDLHLRLGNYAAARASYEAAPPSALLAYKLGQVFQRLGEWVAAGKQFSHALATADDDPLRLDALIEAGHVALALGEKEVALARAEQALQVSANSARAHNLRGMIWREDRPNDARSAFEQSLQVANEPESQIAALNNLALLAASRDDHATAQTNFKHALALCRQIGDRHWEAALLNNLADSLQERGDSGQAEQHVRQAVTILADLNVENLQAGVWRLYAW